MTKSNRRQFLADVGKGMLIAGAGPALAADLGLASAAQAADGPDTLNFGDMEPLVCLMQETPADKLLPVLVEKLRKGSTLGQLVAAGALANARTFGGEDYIGFHTMMALSPAYRMSQELPEEKRALPVLKVLYRNASRIQACGGRKKEVLHPVEAEETCQPAKQILAAVHKRDVKTAEAVLAGAVEDSVETAFNAILPTVHEALDVHRIVLPYRAWDLLDIVGKQHAHTLLRQSVRFCVMAETERKVEHFAKPRALLPKLIDQYKLADKPLGRRPAEDAWIDKMSMTIFKSSPEQSAEAVAAALAEGFAPDAVGEALSLAANQLILRDKGRPKEEANGAKPVGSVHGDSIGVHGCDSAHAWRNIARVSNSKNAIASLILGAYQVAMDRTERGGDFINWDPYPLADARDQIKATDAPELVRQVEEAVRAKEQARAAAIVHCYGELGHPARPIFDVLLRFAVSEDGALHAEKYYRTVSEEFASIRAPFRWREVVALARVTASEYGQPAPGYEEACKLLKA